MEQDTKKCPYCGEVIKSTAKKCRFCGEWLDKPASMERTDSHPSEKSKRAKTDIPAKEKVLNAAIVILIIANLTVGFFWIKGWLNPKSVMENDVKVVTNLLSKKSLSNRTDSISYALGCYAAENANQNVLAQWRLNEEKARVKTYAGMLRGLISPNSEKRNEAISIALQNVWEPNIESKSTVGKLERDAVFQGLYDINSTGKGPLLTYEELNSISTQYFNLK